MLMTGYHVGAVATAGLALVVIEPFGWRAMFVVGALPAVVLIPLMLRYLPESPSYLLAHGKHAEAEDIAARYGVGLEAAPASEAGRAEAANPVRALFSSKFLRNSIAIWITSFMGLLLVYGLNTWLPTIMREAGYNLGASLTFLLILNAGAVVGLLIAGGRRKQDRPAYRRHRVVRRSGIVPGTSECEGVVRDLRDGLSRRMLRVQCTGVGLRLHQRQSSSSNSRDSARMVGRCRSGRCDLWPDSGRSSPGRGLRRAVGLLRIRACRSARCNFDLLHTGTHLKYQFRRLVRYCYRKT